MADFLTFDKRASFLEICILNNYETACGALFPSTVRLDLLSKIFEDGEEGCILALFRDDNVGSDHQGQNRVRHGQKVFTLDEDGLMASDTEHIERVNSGV